MSIKKRFTFILFIAIANFSFGQNLKFTINGLPDTTVHLVKYVGKGMYYADTTQSKKGVINFDGKKHKDGVYALFLPGQKYFDFMHDNEVIDISVGNIKELIGSLKVKKSKSNIAFYEYVHFMTDEKKKAGKISENIKTLDGNDKEKAEGELKQINDKVIAYQNELVNKFKGKLLGDVINMSIDVVLPEAPKDENGVITDSNFVYNYYINHFWDNTNLKNEAITRTPLFHKKLEMYLSKRVLLQIPDTISKYADLLIAKTIEHSFNYQYIITHVTSSSEKSETMGMENVFVHMADNYYCQTPTKAKWVSEETISKICKRAGEIRPNMVGSIAPRLCLPDSTEKNWVDLHKIKAEYKILYFWEANCGHCKKSTPKLQKLYAEKLKKRGVEIYAVGKAMGSDFDLWKKFISEKGLTFINVGMTKSVYAEAQENAYFILKNHNTTIESLNYTKTYDVSSTPRMFILDKDNKILFKRVSISQMEEILDNLQGVPNAEKLFPIEEESKEEREGAGAIK